MIYLMEKDYFYYSKIVGSTKVILIMVICMEKEKFIIIRKTLLKLSMKDIFFKIYIWIVSKDKKSTSLVTKI